MLNQSIKDEETLRGRATTANGPAEKPAPVVSADKFNFESYYAGLVSESASASEKIVQHRIAEMAKLDALKKQEKVTDAEYKKARTQIYANESASITKLEAEETAKREADLRDFYDWYNKLLNDQASAENEAQKIISENKAASNADEIAKLTAKLDAENAIILQKKQEQIDAGLLQQQTYDALVVSMEEAKQAKIAEAQKKANAELVSSYAGLAGNVGNAFGSIADAVAASGRKQSNTYKAMFALSKGFAVAQAGLNFSLALSQAMADPTAVTLPQKIANYAAVAGTFGTLISSLSAAAYGGGRRYGGPTDANTMYQVNETGVPEMWTGNNGKQYMMTGSQGGSVTPANKINSGVTIIINQNAPNIDITKTESNDGKMIEIAVNQAVATVASQLANNTGQVWNAAKAGTTIQGRTR